ncbi:MAG: serine hydrolase [Calothrix sp. C42_A2020_038]|nr:serine hydrolase [Calothrix sp. C42_A2020_038]
MSINFSPNPNWLVVAILITVIGFISVIIWQRQAIFSIFDIWSVLSEGKEWASQLKTPEDLVEYIVAHPNEVSLVARDIGDSEQEILYNTDIKRPLASTVKILVLAEYARQVENGILSPDELINLENIDLYYLPRTDGDAHLSAIAEFKQKKYINSLNQVELRYVPRAMIRHSDNAATDYLILRLGRDNLENLVSGLNIKDQDVPTPIIGQILTWGNHTFTDTPAERLKKYQAMSPQAYTEEVYRWTEIWRQDQEFRNQQMKYITSQQWLKLKEQQAMAQALNNKGTSFGYAQIMERVYRGLLISPTSDKIMRQYLEWPMELPANQTELDTFGTKNGSLAGIITEAWYIKPTTTNARTAALFFENIPAGAWFSMVQSYVQQAFLYKLLTDENFFNIVRQKLLEL